MEKILIIACLVFCFFGMIGVVAARKKLKAPNSSQRDMIVGFFREKGAVSPETAVAKSELPFYLQSPSEEKNIFDLMVNKKLIRKEGKAFYLDEAALEKLLSK